MATGRNVWTEEEIKKVLVFYPGKTLLFPPTSAMLRYVTALPWWMKFTFLLWKYLNLEGTFKCLDGPLRWEHLLSSRKKWKTTDIDEGLSNKPKAQVHMWFLLVTSGSRGVTCPSQDTHTSDLHTDRIPRGNSVLRLLQPLFRPLHHWLLCPLRVVLMFLGPHFTFPLQGQCGCKEIWCRITPESLQGQCCC